MGQHTPKEGVDYLIDYYAIFGVERTASDDEIKRAHRTQIREYYPDRFYKGAPQLVKQAERRTELLNHGWEIFSDPAKKNAYDELLASWTKPISTDGNPVIDLSASGFSFGTLVEQLEKDPEALEAERQKLARQFSGFDQATFDLIMSLATATPEVPEATQKAYTEQLAKRDLYLALLEGFYFDGLGLRNHSVTPQLHHSDEVTETVADVRSKANQGLQQEVLLLTTGKVALLPAPDGVNVAENPQTALTHYEERIAAHFAFNSEKLQAVAAEREQILKKRFKVESKVTYFDGTREYTRFLVIKVITPKDVNWLGFELNVEETRAVGWECENIESADDPNVARQLMERGVTLVSFHVMGDIDPQAQLEQVIIDHMDRMKP